MIIADKYIYVHMPKTAGSHIEKQLMRVHPGELISQPTRHVKPGRRLRQRKVPFVSSIRNPWSWYLSYWSYGLTFKRTGGFCQTARLPRWYLKNRGWRVNPLFAFHSFLSDYRRDPEAWRACLETSVDDVAAFRAWIRMVHDPRHHAQLGDGYGLHPLRHFAGYYTYTYLRLACAGPLWAIRTPDDLIRYDRERCYIDHFIRTERVAADLGEVLARCDVDIDAGFLDQVGRAPKSNASQKRPFSTEDYYDRETAELVRLRDRLIVEKFGYIAPAGVAV